MRCRTANRSARSSRRPSLASTSSNPQGFQRERDALFDWLVENDFLNKNFYIICGDRHWQYHSRHPRGFEEFSTGGFLNVTVTQGQPPTAAFRFFDEQGELLCEETKVAQH